jgi:hypothetical protein
MFNNQYGSSDNLPISGDALPALASRWRRWLSRLALPLKGLHRNKNRKPTEDRQAVDEWWAETRNTARPRRQSNRDPWIG